MTSFLSSEQVKKLHTTGLFLRHLPARWRRSRRSLPVEDYLKKIDREQIAALALKHYSEGVLSGEVSKHADGPGAGRMTNEGLKYVHDVARNMRTGAGHALDLDLDILPPQRILDLGSGAGYFLHVAQHLGHDCLGVDAPFVPAYQDMTELLGVERMTYIIEPFVALPDFGSPYDLITAFRVCFDKLEGGNRWDVEEWKFFLKDIRRHLKPGGVLQLRLNKRGDKRGNQCYTPALLEFFLAHDAEIYRSTVRFRQESLPT